MVTYNEVKENCYFDSVTLMLFSSRLLEISGVKQAAVMMATEHNKALMLNAGVLEEETKNKANPNDLIIGILADSEDCIKEAMRILMEQFEHKEEIKVDQKKVKSIEAAVKQIASPNFAIVSIPGGYAKHEAMKAMRHGMHVLLFSDNVSIEEENELKDFAIEHNLLMMGPDCGTAIINGVALGFSNVVRKGNIGLVAAAGTGLQEVLVLVDRMGGGISQALGTGGRDVREEIGGKMMLQALEALKNDEATEVIGIISKPPEPSVMQKVLEAAKKIQKPVVACFLGGDSTVFEGAGVCFAKNLQDAAQQLVLFGMSENIQLEKQDIGQIARYECSKFSTKQKYIRGLYSGGTLCYEAKLLLEEKLGPFYSNLSKKSEFVLEDCEISKENTLVDMGDDYFTDGMPHPMIDTRLRSERISKESKDEEVAIILLDCVLGYGCNEDPAQAIVDAVEVARSKNDGRYISFIASVCGTDLDIQNRSKQVQKLTDAGIIVLPSNIQAAELAAEIILQTKS